MPMRPAASPSPTGHRAPPQLPLLLPSALVPMKKRRTPRRARPPATVPVPVPPPAAAALIPVPVPSAPYQIPAPPAAAAAPDAHYLMLLAHTVVSQADAEEAAQAWSPSPPAAPVGEKLSSSPPPLPPSAADEEKPHAPPPPLPPLAVDENPSSYSISMYHHGHGHAATEESAEDCKETACPQPGGNAGGGSSKGDQRGGGVPSPPAAGASPPRPGNEDDEELELGEIPPEKNPAADCNAGSAHESSLGLGKEDATGGSGRHAAPVHAAVTEMSAAEQKRVREVFVGGISRDAGEADVRAALSAAGEITEVRMIRDRTTGKKHKGYCFVAYRDAAMASKAVAEFPSVEVVLACPNCFFSIIFPAHQLCPFYGN